MIFLSAGLYRMVFIFYFTFTVLGSFRPSLSFRFLFQALTVIIHPCVKDASVPSPTASWWGSTTPHGTRSVCSAPCVNSRSPPAATSEKGNFTANTTTNSKHGLIFFFLSLLFLRSLWLVWTDLKKKKKKKKKKGHCGVFGWRWRSRVRLRNTVNRSLTLWEFLFEF